MNRRELTQIYYNEMLEKFLPQIINAFKNGKPETVFELSEVNRFQQLAARNESIHQLIKDYKN